MSVKKKFSISAGTGAASLLTIFLILSLVSFSILSYMTAQADFRFSQSLEERTTAYYEACNKSEAELSRIKSALQKVYQNSTGQTYFASAASTLSNYAVDTVENTLSFETQIRDTQYLKVTIRLEYPKSASDPLYRITGWSVIQTGEWEPDNTLNLLEG